MTHSSKPGSAASAASEHLPHAGKTIRERIFSAPGFANCVMVSREDMHSLLTSSERAEKAEAILKEVFPIMEAALQDIACGRVPRPSKSGMYVVTAADHAREALAKVKDAFAARRSLSEQGE